MIYTWDYYPYFQSTGGRRGCQRFRYVKEEGGILLTLRTVSTGWGRIKFSSKTALRNVCMIRKTCSLNQSVTFMKKTPRLRWITLLIVIVKRFDKSHHFCVHYICGFICVAPQSRSEHTEVKFFNLSNWIYLFILFIYLFFI